MFFFQFHHLPANVMMPGMNKEHVVHLHDGLVFPPIAIPGSVFMVGKDRLCGHLPGCTGTQSACDRGICP